MLLNKFQHDVVHKLLNQLLVLTVGILSFDDAPILELLREMSLEVITENYEHYADLLHMAQFIEWCVVLGTDEPHIFLDKWNSRVCYWYLLSMRTWLWHESKHCE